MPEKYTLEQILGLANNEYYTVVFYRDNEIVNALYVKHLTLDLLKIIYSAYKLGYQYKVFGIDGKETSLLAIPIPTVEINKATSLQKSNYTFM